MKKIRACPGTLSLGQGVAGISATSYLAVAMFAGKLIGGAWADRWSRTNERARILVPAIGLFIAAPATLMLAKILLPETGQPLTRGQVKLQVEKTTANVIDAAATGAADGLRLALNVGAMLLAFIALIALLNAPF